MANAPFCCALSFSSVAQFNRTSVGVCVRVSVCVVFCSLYIYWPDFCLYFPNRFRDFRRVPGVFIIFARTHNKCIYRKSLKHTFRNQGAWTKTNAHQPRGNFYDHFILSRKKSYWFWFAYCNVSMKHIARKTPTTTATIATMTTAMTTKAETTSNEQKSQASKHCKLRYICFYSPIESTLDLFVLYCNWDFFLSLCLPRDLSRFNTHWTGLLTILFCFIRRNVFCI